MFTISQLSVLRVLIIGSICVIGFGTSAAFAEEVYSYTGPNYSPMDCTGSYVANCNSDHLSGSFTTTLSLSQLENLTSYTIPVSDVAAYSFSDGAGLVLGQWNSTVADLGITTNASGQIEWWAIQVKGNDGSSFVDTSSCLPSTCPGGSSGALDASGTSAANAGSTIFEPLGESWSGPASTQSTPEVSGCYLVGIGLLILTCLRIAHH